MDREEESDEIIRRLRAPPTRPRPKPLTSIWTLDDLSMISDDQYDAVSKAIADEIDAEVLKQMKEIYEKTVLYGPREL